MANALTTQILEDGHRNAIVKVVGVLDTSNLAATDIVDPANFSPLPTQFRINRLQYDVTSQLEVQILWDATADVVAATLAQYGEFDARDFGGLQNNAGAGKTGKIQALTTGWASGTQTFTIILTLAKQGTTNP